MRLQEREKRGRNWGEMNTKLKKNGRDCKREKKGKNWGEINVTPKEWDETVRNRRAAKEPGAKL